MTEFERHSTIRTLVASFLFTDLVEYSKGSAADQYAAKNNLSAILRRNLAALHDADYKIKDTGDGPGTDDLRDALDRRVEFKVRSC